MAQPHLHPQLGRCLRHLPSGEPRLHCRRRGCGGGHPLLRPLPALGRPAGAHQPGPPARRRAGQPHRPPALRLRDRFHADRRHARPAADHQQRGRFRHRGRRHFAGVLSALYRAAPPCPRSRRPAARRLAAKCPALWSSPQARTSAHASAPAPLDGEIITQTYNARGLLAQVANPTDTPDPVPGPATWPRQPTTPWAGPPA